MWSLPPPGRWDRPWADREAEGARAVGIAGGPEKCRALIEEFGFDAAIDHRDPNFPDKLAEAVPDGIDVYFENVGGPVQEAVWPLLNTYARIPVCGLVAQYNGADLNRTDRLPGLFNSILTKSLTIRGFIQSEFVKEMYGDFLREASAWVRDGKLKYREDIVDGLENAPEAFIGMLEGRTSEDARAGRAGVTDTGPPSGAGRVSVGGFRWTTRPTG